MDYGREQFRQLGFRCLNPVNVQLLDGTVVTVKAHGYLSSREGQDDTERQKRALRLYSIQRKTDTALELISELELEERAGTPAFDRLPLE